MPEESKPETAAGGIIVRYKGKGKGVVAVRSKDFIRLGCSRQSF